MKVHVQIALEFILTQSYPSWIVMKQDQCLLGTLYCTAAVFQRTGDQ